MLHNQYSPKTLALISILIAVIIGGGVPVLSKIAVREIPSFSFTFLRFVFAAICILPFFLRSKPKFHKDFYKVVLFSLFMSFNVAMFPFGIALTTATISQTLYSFMPIIVALLSYCVLAERFTLQKMFGMTLGFLGALLIITLPVITNNAPFTGNFLGNVIIFSGAVGAAIYTFYSKPFQNHYSPQQLTSIFILITTAVLFFFALSDLWIHPHWWQNVSPISIGSTVYVGLFGTVVWYLLYQYVIKHGSPLIASMSLYLQPAAAFVWASVLLGEQLSPGLVIGAAIAFTGVYLVLKSK